MLSMRATNAVMPISRGGFCIRLGFLLQVESCAVKMGESKAWLRTEQDRKIHPGKMGRRWSSHYTDQDWGQLHCKASLLIPFQKSVLYRAEDELWKLFIIECSFDQLVCFPGVAGHPRLLD